MIEPQEYDAYSCSYDPKTILVMDKGNHGNGPGLARNLCWDHAKENGHKRHWVMDDNINGFIRLHENKRIQVADGGIFRAAEDFVDRFENVPVSGFQYRFYVAENSLRPPFVLNTRIYSCLLIENNCPYRWRGRYNEDTILALDVLTDKDRPDPENTPPRFVTMQFNAFMQNKLTTQQVAGGNTGEFYEKEGTTNKSMMLKKEYPEITDVVWRYNRVHHEVDYSGFRENEPILKTSQFDQSSYEMELVPVWDPKKKL